ncbi:MAG: type III pantothenate kinase [Bacteriovoracaceae bacterium]
MKNTCGRDVTKFFLTIDGGNSLTKSALFDANGELIEKGETDCAVLIQKRKLNPQNTLCALVNVARSSVARSSVELSNFKVFNVQDHFKGQKFFEMPVHYSDSLGMDRLILGYYFYDGESSAALVDSGTFTTVDLVDKDGFQGGHILPGLELLLGNYDFGFKLKSLRPKDPECLMTTNPQNSHDAIASGLTRSFVAPVQSILEDCDFESLQITGGNGKILHKYLKSSPFQRSASIHFNPNLIHLGLLKFLNKAALA